VSIFAKIKNMIATNKITHEAEVIPIPIRATKLERYIGCLE